MIETPHEIAAHFADGREVESVSELGSGNVNDTFLIQCTGNGTDRFVLQRLNTLIFKDVEAVISNIRVVTGHVRKGRAAAAGLELPTLLATGEGAYLFKDQVGNFWRAMRYIEGVVALDKAESPEQAGQAGVALGRMHALMLDIPVETLRTTLPGFHQTPLYLRHYQEVLRRVKPVGKAAIRYGMAFIEDRQEFIPVLEEARAQGKLVLRPIHGDPKLNNILVDAGSGKAKGMVDLDTLQPGLLHYDLGDCLRSCCNPAGEEAIDLERVKFSLDFCRAILGGYCGEMGRFMTNVDFEYLFAAVRLIALELGLRFFTDHLEGDVYFKTNHPGHNLHRALVQFRLVEEIERQEPEFKQLVREHAKRNVS